MMKQKLLFTFALLLTAVTGAWADSSCGDGLTWSLSGGTLTISKTGEGTGAMTNSDLQNVPWYNERNNITSVVIGDGVTGIGQYAFFNCSNLASLTIGSSLQSIGIWAFSGCSKLASVNLPASVTNIGDNAFYDCSNLSSVVIHATSVPTCGNNAFGMYKSGRKIFVPFAKVADYKTGWSAYAADIYGYSDCGATGHESDVIYALTGTSPNYTLYIMKVGATGAMKNCDLEDVPWDNERNNITSVVIGDGVTAIGKYAFYNCSNLASVTIGSSLQSIGVCAFSGCSKLASVNLPATMTSIGDNAFDNCSNLSSVVIHATSVPTCLSDAFKANKAGRKIFVPFAKVDDYKTGWSAYAADIIGYNGTCGATGHESDVVYALTGESPNRTLYISGTGAMKDDYKPWSDFTTVIIGDGVTHIGKQSFDYKSFTSLTIGNGVKSIGELAFHNCSGLTSIVIPNSVETIGEKAFEFITTLTSLTIGSGVTSMADNAFDYCANVTSLTISDGVTTIGKGAFEKYSSLTSVVIPSSVTSIGNNAFKDCPQLSSVVIRSPSLTTYGSQAFDENKDGRNIFVPATNLNAYKAGWTTYANDIIGYNGTCGATGHESDVLYAMDGESPNKTLYIVGTGAMADYDYNSMPWNSQKDAITSVVIGDGVTGIGQYAFYEHSHLASVTFRASVISIGNSSFSGCNNLTSVTLNSNPQIQPNAFPGTATVTMNLTANPVGDDKWMTFFNDGYHFKAGENTTVYKGTLSGSSIVLKPVEDKIVTARTAVILKSTGNPVMTLNSEASSDTNSNSLQGVSNLAGKTAANPSTTYVLNYKEGTGVGFYKLKSGKTLGYGKAYLDTSTTGAPSYLNFEENETTEVREVKEVNVVIEVNDNSWYTLDGRKMDSKPTAKGLYIVNGKKVVIK